VRADAYAKQGGMNRRKAGEDFYFLQKIIMLGNYGEINSTKVIPSPRTSDRVPFGTGAAISKMLENNTNVFTTYNFDAFILLKSFFKNIPSFYKLFSYENIEMPMQEFLKMNNFEDDYIKIKKNSPTINIFTKRFFDWFNAFRVIKFLNFAHENLYTKKPVQQATKQFLDKLNLDNKNLNSSKELLIFMRNNF